MTDEKANETHVARRQAASSFTSEGQFLARCAYCPCGNGFTPIRRWQRFCSTQCRNDYHNILRGKLKDAAR